ncbi:MAG: hypothetical protein QXT57_03885, partial [Thermosphaera sp.]
MFTKTRTPRCSIISSIILAILAACLSSPRSPRTPRHSSLLHSGISTFKLIFLRVESSTTLAVSPSPTISLALSRLDSVADNAIFTSLLPSFLSKRYAV